MHDCACHECNHHLATYQCTIVTLLAVDYLLHMQANTFQVVMATDGEKSFVFFTYFDIQWGEGTVGFDAGDGVRSFTLNGSLTAATQDIERRSNVDVEGLYAYRVDLPEIISPGGEGYAKPVTSTFTQ